MSDAHNAARVAWATVKLSEVGQRPVRLDDIAAHVGLTTGEALQVLRLTWRHQFTVHDGLIQLDLTPAGPRRYQVHADGQPLGSRKGCSVDM